jgi:site-specific DNA-methyltransferase (adenine-specific)/modification methylase
VIPYNIITKSNPVIIGDCTLYCGDSKYIISQIDNVDAVVTDPPYGINENNKKNLSRGKKAKARDYGEFTWDNSIVDKNIIDLIRQKSRFQIIFGGNYYELPSTSCWLVWDKQNGNNDFADCELAWTNLKIAVRRIYWRWNGMIRRGHDERVHPTQKPLGVMRWCLEKLPKDANTILDPFMGSGTTGVACAMMGRKFIGVELDQKYFDIACKRIKAAYKQPDLFVEDYKPPEQVGMEL